MELKKSKETTQLYELAGVCLHLCANIEYGLTFLLQPDKWSGNALHLDRMKAIYKSKRGIKDRVSAMKKVDEALNNVNVQIDNLEKCPLGSLIAQLKAHPLTDEQIEYFEEILKKRNYLVHHIWGNYGRKLKDPEILKKMQAELFDLQFYFKSASDWIWSQAYKRNGVSSEHEATASRTE